MIWLLYVPLNIICMVMCYLTNWFVCLFCDEKGDLPEIFSLWQTWDDSCDPRFYVMEKAPKFLRYDYDRHYEEYEYAPPELAKVGCTRFGVKIKDPNFTFKEKVQRYCCRVGWLTRNCAYGFAFWGFGRQVDCKDMKLVNYKFDGDHVYRFGYDPTQSIFTRVWTLQRETHIAGRVYWNNYLGWKFHSFGETGKKQCMIANRIAFSIEDK